MRKARLLRVVSVLLLLCTLLAACSGSPNTEQPEILQYDLDSGEELVLPVTAGADCVVYIGNTRLDKTEYTVNEKEIHISAYSLMFLNVNTTYTVKVETASEVKEFQVQIISSSTVSMDEADVTFDYANPTDLVKTADFGDQTVSEIRLGARKYADKSLYHYDSTGKTLTFKKELLMGLTGETKVLIRLSGGKEFSFTVSSSLVANADFEEPDEVALLTGNYGMFWDAKIETIKGENGSMIGKVVPQYDHLFVFGDHYWSTIGGVAFEKGASYQLEFDIKPDAASTEKTLKLYLRKAFDSYDPRCGIEPDGEGDDVQKYYVLDMSGTGCTGEGNFTDITYVYDETTGYTHVTVRFKAATAYNTILNCNTGNNYFDGDRPGENGVSNAPTNADNIAAYEAAKGICWYFDNVKIVKQ